MHTGGAFDVDILDKTAAIPRTEEEMKLPYKDPENEKRLLSQDVADTQRQTQEVLAALVWESAEEPDLGYSFTCFRGDMAVGIPTSRNRLSTPTAVIRTIDPLPGTRSAGKSLSHPER